MKTLVLNGEEIQYDKKLEGSETYIVFPRITEEEREKRLKNICDTLSRGIQEQYNIKVDIKLVKKPA